MKSFFYSAVAVLATLMACFAQATANAQTYSYNGLTVTVLSQPQVTYNHHIVFVNFDIAYSGLFSNVDNLSLGEAAYEPEGTVSPTYKNNQGYYVAAFGDTNYVIPGPRKGGAASGSAFNGVSAQWSPANAAGTYTVTIAWGYAYPGAGTEYYQQIGPSMQFQLVWDGTEFTGASLVGYTPSELTQSPPTAITPQTSSTTYGGTPLSFTISGGGGANGVPEGPAQLEWSTDGAAWYSLGVTISGTTTATFVPPAAGNYQFRAHWDAGNGYTASFDSGSLATASVGKAVLTVTPDSLLVPAGKAAPPYNASYSGFIPPDTFAKTVTGSPGFSSLYKSSSPVGSTFTVNCSAGTLASSDYTFSYSTGTLKVVDLPSANAHKNGATLGGPVQLATGAEAFSRPLFSFSGARNWGLAISYNSILAGDQTQVGSMGYGWEHPFETHVVSIGGDEMVYWDAVHYNTFTPYVNSSGVIQYYSCSDQGEFYDRLVPAGSGGGWTLTRQDQSQLLFNSSGQLVEDHDSHGRKLVLSYNANGQLASVTDPVSLTSLSFGYNSAGLVSGLTDAAGKTVSFTYDSNSQLTEITDQNGYQVTFGYDANHHLLTLTGNDGTVLTTDTYDASGRVLTQTDGVPGHHPLQFSYQQTNPATSMVTTVTDKVGNVWVYTSDPYTNLLSVKNPLGKTKSYTYNAAGLCLSMKDEAGDETDSSYDSYGNLSSVSDPAYKVTNYTYNSQNDLLSATDPLSHVTRYTYDTTNNVSTATDQAGNKTTWTYDANSMPLTKKLPAGGTFSYTYASGELTKVQDPNGVVTQFTYDGDGRLLTSTDALGKVTTFTYDAVGNLLTTTDPLSEVTARTYDYRNRLTTLTDPVGAITKYSYDNNNNLLTVTDPLSNVTTNAYDGNDRLTNVTDPLGHVRTLVYDAAGELTSATDPTNNTTQYQYDAAGRCTATIDPLSRKLTETYDPRSLLLSITDPLNRTTNYAYDAASRRTTATDPLNNATTFAYDAANRLTGVTDPAKLATTEAFDADGNRDSLADAAGNSTAFAFDPGDRPTAITTAGGRKTSYAYDVRGLPSTITQPSTTTSIFTYDDAGRVATVADPVGTITYTRDKDGRVLTETENGKTLTRVYDAAGRLTQFTDGSGDVIGYAYDGAGNLSTLTYPDGKTVTYGYDSANRLTSVKDWAARVTTYQYDADGRLSTTTRPNGTVQTRTYDVAGELSSISETGPGGSVIYSNAYTYDAASRLTSESASPSMAVPAAGQLTQTFDVDNRLLTSASQSATFDANGNLLSLPGATPSSYAYDARNRLTSGGAVSYGYDCDGDRVSLTDSTGTTTFVVNPNSSLSQLLVRAAPDGTVTRYVYGLGLAYEETGTNTRYYHYNSRGDTVALTDGSGSVTGRVLYGIYGETVSQTGQANTPFLFDGLHGVMTDANGLCYHRARYYNPLLRRFVNQDPTFGNVAAAASLNRFAYADGRPIDLVDPFGLMAQNLKPDSLWNDLIERLLHAPAQLELASAQNDIREAELIGLLAADWDNRINQAFLQAEMEQAGPGGVVDMNKVNMDTAAFELVTMQTLGNALGELGALTNGIASPAPEEEAPLMRQLEQQQAQGTMTQWGWRGGGAWRDAVRQVDAGGTIESIGGNVPTQAEATQLIEDASGTIERIEDGHLPPNPHTYPHINYTTASGAKGTIQIGDW